MPAVLGQKIEDFLSYYYDRVKQQHRLSPSALVAVLEHLYDSIVEGPCQINFRFPPPAEYCAMLDHSDLSLLRQQHLSIRKGLFQKSS